ncbi:MAG TPA: PBP1A family penicillin-binding protein [Candidatus Saccharimonadales bacterium]|nr:PBP1A family penicillin-binding protein [Candidatus Saccharimonadales bacterium]
MFGLLGMYIPFALRVSAIRGFRHTGPGWSFPSKVYSDWLDLTPGRLLPPSYLEAELDSRGYAWVNHEELAPGEYTGDGGEWRVHLRGFDYPDGRAPGEEVELSLRAGRLAEVRRSARSALPARLEPVLVGEWAGDWREERTYVPLDSVPQVLRDAVVASEDRRFYHHIGFDPRGILRAMFHDVRGRGVRQGGSTLTQQLARNLFLSRRRTVERKAREALLAMALELRLSKQRILELYLNSVYLGQRGSSGIAGVEEAARFYFSKPVSRLSLPEAATLAAVIPAPNAFSPVRRPELARERRDVVLDIMAGEGFISRAAAEAAKAVPLRVNPGDPPPARFGYFTDYAHDFLAAVLPDPPLETRGLRVFTTLDPAWQERAEGELLDGIRSLDGESGDLQGAFCAADLHTGAVRALVGGRDHSESSFNRAYQSHRQPGSAFKPVVYASAYDENAGHSPYTPATTVPDVQRDFPAPEAPWRPRNYEGEYHPSVTLAKALAKSLNVATANLVERVGARRVADYAARFGLPGMKAVASIGLGTNEVTLVQLLGVLTAIGSDGRRTPLNPIHVAVDGNGKILYQPAPPENQVISPLAAHLMVEQLRGVVNFGTAFSLRGAFGFRRPVIGKTGTTNDENDAWFIGATPEIAAGVWLGYDQPRSLQRSGSQAAVPVWARVMAELLRDFPPTDFPAHPDELENATIDAYDGLLANPHCPSVIRTAFVLGSAPSRVCPQAHPEAELPDTTLGLGDTVFTAPFEVDPEGGP